MTKSFQLLGNPERPVAVAARVADENIGHAAKLAPGPSNRCKEYFRRLPRAMQGRCGKDVRVWPEAVVRECLLSRRC
jgi:hypothetical protein